MKRGGGVSYLVPSGQNLPSMINNIPIKPIDMTSEEERSNLVIISQIEKQYDIFNYLNQNGFNNIVYYHRRFLSLSIKERVYYEKAYGWNINVSVPQFEKSFYDRELDLKIYVVTSHFDLHKSNKNLMIPRYSTYIQAGADLTEKVMCELRDNLEGNNISNKNAMYCELTALYWIVNHEIKHDYIGFNLYSRIFDLDEVNLKYILSNGIEVIVPEPEILMPLFKSPHIIGEYLKETIMKVCPSYLKTYNAILKENICIPSNLIIASGEIFYNYAKWLFKVLEFYESTLIKNAQIFPPRHFGYIAEMLMTVYFLHHSADLNILFVRRKFLF